MVPYVFHSLDYIHNLMYILLNKDVLSSWVAERALRQLTGKKSKDEVVRCSGRDRLQESFRFVLNALEGKVNP